MSKLSLYLSYKNILILKHSLEMRIKNDQFVYEIFKKEVQLKETATDDMKKFVKEHEEHQRCLKALEEDMHTGYNSKVFG